ncbi:MAG TPA: ribonucleoside-diphosphate reductase subunit alpha, partial [Acidimicrobiales bacterium]|nr:ribonucleoside-diphosphate reductase subunit alpha [Acidimicrobiales bacterium]
MPATTATTTDTTDTNETTAAALPGAETLPTASTHTPMRVRKRDGSLEPVDVNRVVRAVERAAAGLPGVDPLRVATRTISGLCDGATTSQLDEVSIRTAAALIADEPSYSQLAARLLGDVIDKEVRHQGISCFSDAVMAGHRLGLVSEATAAFVHLHASQLDAATGLGPDGYRLFEFFGLRSLYDRYLLRHPETRSVIETPQFAFLRVACGLATSATWPTTPTPPTTATSDTTPTSDASASSAEAEDALELYGLMSRLEYLPSSPTLFNSGTVHPQMSSCYLLDSPADELDAIYRRYLDVARLSKHAGGIGLAFHRVRSRGSLIRGTNGLSKGIVPWLKTLDCSVAAVNQGGRRKGAACVYLETWHADIEEFLELRDGTGDDARRARNINLANWVPDLFMHRVEHDWVWSLFDPKKVPSLADLYGQAFEEAYVDAERQGLYERQVPARQLYARMMRTLAETGNGWMTFKDASNKRCNQTGRPGRVVHSSNLCTEILEVDDQEHTAVCNLGSVNLATMVRSGQVDYQRLGVVVRTAVKFLDRVIDINFYPTEAAARSNAYWRPVGIGVMGLQDVFFKLRWPFDSTPARNESRRIAEEIYLSALWASTELAERCGPHPGFEETRAAAGHLQFDLWGEEPAQVERWSSLRERIDRFGLRNSLLVAIAPTATIASIAGAYECIEPQVSNLFKRETLSGEFLQVNTYLVRDLQALGLWDDKMAAEIRRAEGSVQDIAAIPAPLKEIYRTAWELPMRSLIDMAAERSPFVDQSQSLNLFVESPTIAKLSSMYMYAWKRGLKTTYYLRSRP